MLVRDGISKQAMILQDFYRLSERFGWRGYLQTRIPAQRSSERVESATIHKDQINVDISNKYLHDFLNRRYIGPANHVT